MLQQRKAAVVFLVMDGDGKIVNSSYYLFLAEKALDMHSHGYRDEFVRECKGRCSRRDVKRANLVSEVMHYSHHSPQSGLVLVLVRHRHSVLFLFKTS